MKCQECGAINAGGSVFCTYCRARIVVASSDALPSEYDEEKPYFAVQFWGEISSYDAFGFAIRYVIYPMIIIVFAAVLAAALMGVLGFLVIVLAAVLYLLLIETLLLIYRRKFRPIDFGGSGGSSYPRSSDVEQIENDHLRHRR